MAPSDAKSFAKKQAKQDEKRNKLREKLADPAYRAAQQAKQRAAQDRRVAKMKAQMADPEYQREQAEKRQKAIEKQRQKAATPKPAKPKAPPVRRKASKTTSTRGMKGRTPTADERRIMDAIGKLPCICCYLRGRTNPVISLHHTDGRVKPDAHKKVLPLCAGHHDTPADKGVRDKYPDMIPFHAKGALGGPGAWRAEFGHEQELMALCYEQAGLPLPPFLIVEHPNTFG